MYQVATHELAGLTLIEAHGSPFTHFELWELIGESGGVATFYFLEGSAAFQAYGAKVVGVIAYTVEERTRMSCESLLDAVKVETFMRELPVEDAKVLKYQGVPIEEIGAVTFLPWRRPIERHPTGEKAIPNVITIPYKHNPTVDPDRMRQSYLTMKINDGIELTPYEKEVFIGITLGINEGHIDSRILKHLGHDAESASKSVNVGYHSLKNKQRRRALTESEAQAFKEIEEIRLIERVNAVLKEVIASKLTAEETEAAKAAISEVMQSIKRFEPSVLLHGRPQVHWDIESYAHIAMRHVKDFQVGRFREKSIFPYRVEDLEGLIEKVLGTLRQEIEHHYKDAPEKAFTRHGAMSVFFNGDYYSLRIDPSGRLVAFYVRTYEWEADESQ